MSIDSAIEAYEKMKSEDVAVAEPEKVIEPANEDVAVEENKEPEAAVESPESTEEVAVEDSSPDDLIEFQVGEETKKVPLSELVASYSEKQQPKDVGLPQDVLDMKQQLIEKLDVMEKILSDNSDVSASLSQVDALIRQAAAEDDWTEVAKLQYQKQSIEDQAKARGEALRKIREEKQQESNQYNEAFFREQHKILEKRAPDLLKDNGLQKVAEFVSKTYDVPQNIVAEIMDARFFVMAKDAMAYNDMKIKSSEVLKPVKEAPKVIKRSVGKVTVTDSDIKQSNIRTLRANIRNASSQSEKIDNVAALWRTLKTN
jgi:hypothetical protein